MPGQMISPRWDKLTFDLADTSVPPSTGVDLAQPCVLRRGPDNWLSRLSKDAALSKNETDVTVRQEVRALSAYWLRMQNVCSLIGAGASRYALGFVGQELFSRVRELLEARPSAALFDALIATAPSSANLGRDFEPFLSQMTHVARLFSGSAGPLTGLASAWSVPGVASAQPADALVALLRDIERAIMVLCSGELPTLDSTIGSSAIGTPHEAFLAKLVSRDPQQGRGRLFTTNYDTLLEQAMDRLGIVYADGFSGTIARRFSPSSYDVDLYYPGDVSAGRVRRYDKVLQLFKLHGSINWRRAGSEPANAYGVFIDYRPLPGGRVPKRVENPKAFSGR